MNRTGAAPLLFVAALLLLSAGWIAVSAFNDLRGRTSSPEAVVRNYFRALEDGDAPGALAALPPSSRPQWTSFVENGLLNEYRITGIAVRSTSLLDQLGGVPPGPQDVTVFLDITQSVDGVRWQAGPRVPLVQLDGRWYLAHPPLAEPG